MPAAISPKSIEIFHESFHVSFFEIYHFLASCRKLTAELLAVSKYTSSRSGILSLRIALGWLDE